MTSAQTDWTFFLPFLLPFFLVLAGAAGMVFLMVRALGGRPSKPPPRGRRSFLSLGAVVLLVLVAWPLGVYFSFWNDRPLFSLHVNDDFKEWKKMDAVAPKAPERGWVNDAAGSAPWTTSSRGIEIQGRRPGPRGEIVGYSRNLEPELDAARGSARGSAMEQLKALLLWDLRDLRTRGGRVRLQVALRLAEAKLASRLSDLVVDSFDQEVHLSSGSVYRSALLVKADKTTLQSLEKDLERALRDSHLQDAETRRTAMTAAASALGLALIIFLLYAFLNASTKGYFAWPLRVLSLGALLILYLGLMYLNGWFPE